MAVRTIDCPRDVRAGRLGKAEQFARTADIVETLADEDSDVRDAFVTLCVHAGIAAADVVCCARLGMHAKGESHEQAVQLLGRVDRSLAKALGILLGLKTRSGYSHVTTSGTDQTRAKRAMEDLMEAARREHGAAG
ncbi:hypothetical protein [Jatrophihabitans sp.]|uniref:hypothetical protein n=1 Tax=Jatrophihabitans sp. TaxID=1932789 RepID=UPI002F0D5611